MTGQRRSLILSPLTEAVIAKVQQNHLDWHRTRLTRGEALDWVMNDIKWCEPGVPAYGRWSPVLGRILREALEEVESDSSTGENA